MQSKVSSGKRVHLVGAGSGRCLDVPNANTANGTQPVIWDCNGGANQRWTFQSNGPIRNNQSGLCLDVNNNQTPNGTLTLQWTCTGAANQLWSRR